MAMIFSKVIKRLDGLSLIVLMLLLFIGCEKVGQVTQFASTKKSFHDNFAMRAENFFDDPDVISLCHAIEENELKKMSELIDSGVDLNAKGEGNMTPLLWSFPDNNVERFELLLQNGADPNVKLSKDIGSPRVFKEGDSVMMLAAKSFFPQHFEIVLKYGGDPNITDKWGNPVLHEMIASGAGDVRAKVRALVSAGADVNALDSAGWPATVSAIAAFQQYDVVQELLDLGAKPQLYKRDVKSKLIHSVVRRERDLHLYSREQQAAHKALLDRLIALGEDPVAAREDNKRWNEAIPPF